MKTELVHSYSANSLVQPTNIRTRKISPAPRFDYLGPIQDERFVDLRRNMTNRPSIISEVDLLKKKKPDPNQGPDDEPPELGSGLSGYIQDWSSRTFKKKILYKKIPFLSWIQTYSLHTFIGDLIAGLTIGMTVLPQSLAYATIADLPPQVGLYSGLVGPFIYVIFGTSKYVTIGPTAGMAMITLSYIEGKPPELSILLCFLTGVITLILGILQMGFVLNFLSVPVIRGFTSAMVIAICSTQLPALLGLHFTADGFIHMLEETYHHIDGFQWPDTLLGVIGIVVLLILQHTQAIAKRLVHPNKVSYNVDNFLWFISTARNIIVVTVCTAVLGYLGDDPPVEIIKDITPGLPDFHTPPFSAFHWNNTNHHTHAKLDLDHETEPHEYSINYFLNDNRAALLLVPLIALAEHITIAKDIDGGKDRVDTSQEMICIGLSNLIGSFLGSMPVTGSFVRPNHVNQSSRDQSPFGGAIVGILVILTLLYLTPYFNHIPRATIAAVIVAGVIVEFDIGIIRSMWKSKKFDIIPWVTTFVVGLVINLEYGLLLGLGISVVYILYYAALPQIRVNMGKTATGKDFVMVELDRSMIFPSVDYSQYALLKSGTHWAQDKLPIVIDCQHVQFVDYTAAHGIQSMFVKFNAKPQKLILWKMKPSVLRIVGGVLECSGVPYKHCSTERELEEWLDLDDTSVSVESEENGSSSNKKEKENENDQV